MIVEDAQYTVAAKRQRTPVIAELLLRPAGPPLRYRSGQYVLLGDPDADLVIRSYSIANAPRRDGLISLLVTRVSGGQLSGWVHGVLRAGDRVLLSGPYGSFTAAPGKPGPVLLLAGGSGLAPVRALAEAALRRRTPAPVALFFSARTDRDLIDDERFRSWQRRHPGRFRYLRTLTRAGGPPPAGRIPAILGGWFGDLSGWRVYIAGAPGFVTACEAAARARGQARPGAHRGVLHRAAAVGSRAAGRSHREIIMTRSRIYTKTGDDGTTGLLHGGRVSKGDELVDAYGDIDEAVAALGAARAAGLEPRLAWIVPRLQREMFAAAADLAASPRQRRRLAPGISLVTAEMTAGVEQIIDDLVAERPLRPVFVVPSSPTCTRPSTLAVGPAAELMAEHQASYPISGSTSATPTLD